MSASSRQYCTEGTNRTNSLLTQKEWGERYPKTAYQKGVRHAKTHTLHYLLALDQSDATCFAFMERAKTSPKIRAMIIKPDPQNNDITPLIIMSMKGRINCIAKFLSLAGNHKELQKSINAFDRHGWTALHHSVISSKEVFDLLRQNGANEKAKTMMLADCRALASMINLHQPPIFSNVFFYEDDSYIKQALVHMSAEKINTLFHMVKIKAAPYYPPEQQRQLWTRSSTNKLAWLALRASLKRFEYSPPKLIIRSCPSLEKISVPHMELIAGESLPVGSIVAAYGGTVQPDNFKQKSLLDGVQKDTGYQLDKFNAKEVGGVARFANHGFPNTGMLELGSSYLVTLRPIKKGEPILFDYGYNATDISYGKTVPFGFEEMCSLFSSGYEKLLEKLMFASERFKQRNTAENYLEMLRWGALLEFPLNNPSAMLVLHCRNIVSIQSWMKVVNWSALIRRNSGCIFVDSWKAESRENALVVVSFTKRVHEFDQHLQKLSEAQRNLINKWIQDQIGNLSLMQILKGLEIIAQKVTDSDSLVNIKIRLDELVDELVVYAWENDELAPLSYERRYQDIFHELAALEKAKSTNYLIQNINHCEKNGMRGFEYFRMLRRALEEITNNLNDNT